MKILKADIGYSNNVKQYTKKDGICAIALFLIMCILYGLIGLLSKYDFIKNNIKLVGCLFNILIIIITVIFVKINKQKIDSIGIGKGRCKLSIIMGVILGLFYFYCNCISHLIEGSKLVSLNSIIYSTIYFFFVALCEEIVFRGYIGTRIYGLIKNKYVSILFVSLLFILMHFPYRMVAGNKSFIDIASNIDWIINLFIFHIIMNFIYLKTNSLYGAIIPHWISDLAYDIISR